MMSSLSITIIQSALHWEDKQANLQMFAGKINSITGKTHVVVLPEMFSTGFSMRSEQLAEKMDGPTIGWMKAMAASKKIILTGSIIAEDNGRYFNRLIWMLPNGQFGYYDKRHRFAYAGEDKHYTAGQKRLIASVMGWRINLQVCYDLRFPVWARQQLQQAAFDDNATRTAGSPNAPVHPASDLAPEYDILLYVANWPERRIHAWKTLLVARAIENQCFAVGVNRVGTDGNNIYYNGDSMVVDPLGEVLYQRSDAEDIFTITLAKERLEAVRSRFPFWKDADAFHML